MPPEIKSSTCCLTAFPPRALHRRQRRTEGSRVSERGRYSITSQKFSPKISWDYFWEGHLYELPQTVHSLHTFTWGVRETFREMIESGPWPRHGDWAEIFLSRVLTLISVCQRISIQFDDYVQLNESGWKCNFVKSMPAEFTAKVTVIATAHVPHRTWIFLIPPKPNIPAEKNCRIFCQSRTKLNIPYIAEYSPYKQKRTAKYSARLSMPICYTSASHSPNGL